jgi:hypothetical protein
MFLARDLLSNSEKLVNNKTQFLNDLLLSIRLMQSQTNSLEMKKIIEKIYETARYADPVSHTSVSNIETEIVEITKTMDPNNFDMKTLSNLAEQLIVLISERSRVLKIQKNKK